jgi:hypothetical protein
MQTGAAAADHTHKLGRRPDIPAMSTLTLHFLLARYAGFSELHRNQSGTAFATSMCQ